MNRFSLFLILMLGLYASTGSATSVIWLSETEVVQQASLIVQGEVLSTQNVVDDSPYPRTRINLRITDVLKGETADSEISLEFLGGYKDGRELAVAGMQIPEVGEQGIYFIALTGEGRVHPLVGWQQGHYVIQGDPDFPSALVQRVDRLQSRNSHAAFPLDRFKRLIRSLVQ